MTSINSDSNTYDVKTIVSCKKDQVVTRILAKHVFPTVINTVKHILSTHIWKTQHVI